MNKRIYLFIQIVTLFAFSFFLIGCEDNNSVIAPTIRPVKTLLIEVEASNARRSFPGRAQAVQEIDLSFKIGGRLIERPINVGDLVKKDQVIARLDSREFEARLRSARAEAQRDEQNYRRAQQLTRGGHISKADFELLKTKAAIAKANVDLAEKTLADSVIKAPFSGRIASISVKNHQTVTANQPIARLLDTSHIEMVVQVPETLISVIPHLTEITVQFDAFSHVRIPAVIKEISNEASTDTRTFPVTLSMDQPANVKILPGMAGSATGTIVSSDNADGSLITLPVAAVFSPGQDKNSYVWIVDKNTKKVHQQQVSIGELTATGIAITSGLKANDLVVIAGVHSLREGDVVTLLNQSGE
ncbi:efflux RND transporter periplasmic adaptor subunit [uncultured Legionella sp.]|uniref:efflux RND transporter periplasmic adaptor subunit n=1 Tax=uncultured Legionella sp. TaxID=210934 RepID=UPI00261743D0|nr:efflux RND transporter periplasmic adaptor subunit [uncultured Legionella sp.]